MDTTKSKKVLEGFERVIKVPQRRFYPAIKQLSGKTGEEAGGYTKAAGAANINFSIIQKDALIQYTKHAAPKIIAPENNPDADAYVFGYRMPYRTGATIKLTVAQTDPRVPEIVTEEPQVVYLYNGVSRSGKPLNYTKTKNPLAGGHWDRALVAAEGDALAADLERYIGKRSGE